MTSQAERTPPARQEFDLGALEWTLYGFTPYHWRFASAETGMQAVAEVGPVPARLPGSVQAALRAANLLPDWNVALAARECEWVENRHWLFEAALPDAWALPGRPVRLRCLGLDYSGWVLVNGVEAGAFAGSFAPHVFDLTGKLAPSGNRLQLLFDVPPRWLGQFGFTSRMTQWKPRFNYTWDWLPRNVQIGVWDDIVLEAGAPSPLEGVRCTAGGRALRLWVGGPGAVPEARVALCDGDRVIREGRFAGALEWRDLPVEPWWPNGTGAQKLYRVTCRTGDEERTWRVGFKAVRWLPCEGAPPGADPWICEVNGLPIFLQGVNWTPIRPHFADLTAADYRRRLETYRDLGCNVLRVWGGAFLEKDVFYRLCDELGLLVWQEFPLSSSGPDNWPPEDAESGGALGAVAESYIARRQHHASLLLWCGGNELQGGLDGSKAGIGRPVTLDHPLMKRFAEIVGRDDPGRRFLPASASGPRFVADAGDFGKGLHWDVHGPWRGEGEEYWSVDDALFRSEVGAPGASPAELIERFAGGLPPTPGTTANPLWQRFTWWVEWPRFVRLHGREPRDLREYVAWSQARQAEGLVRAARACKRRFPRCGGFIVWMGHDSFPCPANTAILDFDGNPKPAALALGEVFRDTQGRDGGRKQAP